MWVKALGSIFGVASPFFHSGFLWHSHLREPKKLRIARQSQFGEPPMEALVRDLLAANPGVSEEQVWQYLQLRSREYDSSFRSPLTTARESAWASHSKLEVMSRCHCGKCKLRFQIGKEARPIRCHCSSCRHFHSSSFAAYLPADSADWHGVDAQRDACSQLGEVERFICKKCYSKLGTRVMDSQGRSFCCLGSVEDDSIPDSLALAWQRDFEEWKGEAQVAWWQAKAERCAARRSQKLRGSCACKSCSYEALLLPGELQHCYCNLCRRLSGSVAQTWVPASKECFSWISDEHLVLLRTTGHGQRHFCTRCGTCLTIVYDSQPDCIWPAAGTFEDSEALKAPGLWYRVIHICCSMMQRWYQLPDDELPRLKYAG